MLKIGLTGGIGSGKSTVAEIFSILHAPVYFADHEAKALMERDSQLIKKISRLFGPDSYNGDKLNTTFIAREVFNSPEKLKELNAIVHPRVKENFLAWCANHAAEPYILQEAAILYESGSDKLFDYIVVVDAPLEERIQRVMQRDHLSRENVMARINNQMPAEEKAARADFVISNFGEEMLLPQVHGIHNKFVSLQLKNLDHGELH